MRRAAHQPSVDAPRPRRGRSTLGGLVALAAALTGGLAATMAAAGAPPARLLVTATEFRFGLSRGALPEGRAVVQLANRGQDAHDLVVRRLDRRGRLAGAAPAPRPETRPGAVSTQRLTLRPGRYLLLCSLPGHRAAGMQARLTVRERS